MSNSEDFVVSCYLYPLGGIPSWFYTVRCLTKATIVDALATLHQLVCTLMSGFVFSYGLFHLSALPVNIFFTPLICGLQLIKRDGRAAKFLI